MRIKKKYDDIPCLFFIEIEMENVKFRLQFPLFTFTFRMTDFYHGKHFG